MPIYGHLATMLMWWTIEIAVFVLVSWLFYASFTDRGKATPPQDEDVQEYERRLNASTKKAA